MSARSCLAVPTINFLLLLLLLCCLKASHAKTTSFPSCVPSSCGEIHNIRFPFRLKGDPENCGSLKYELECQNNQLTLSLNSMRYLVQSIDYELYTIRLLDPALQKSNPCSFSFNYTENADSYLNDAYSEYSEYSDMNTPLAFINCPNPVNSSTHVDISFCASNLTSSGTHRYVVAVENLTLSDLEVSCGIDKVIPIVRLAGTNYASLSSLHEAAASGFELSWYNYLCRGCYGICSIKESSLICEPYKICYEDTPYSSRSFRCKLDYWAPFIVFFGVFPIVIILGLRLLCGLPSLIALIVYNRKRRNLWSEREIVQELVKGENQFKPIQYSQPEIKKMTNNFKEKLGVGSHGDIFRGKLRSGPIVAVKMVDKAAANSEEFLRFVAAVGRVEHVNVMQLIGFCFEGQKRALVYDFMPNGSIQNYISPKEGDSNSASLSCEILYGISLGVAHGIVYLHRNCDSQAPHLGFRPHNVLLDENLVPKISDFGVAKLYPRLSYEAPEFYYKSSGEVNQKADVYSFGMLLVGMISTMKNVNSSESQNNSSSSWIYDQLVQGNKDRVEIRDGSAEERKMIKKMIKVASLCVQMMPADRPSMDEVVKILEEDGDAEI